MTAALWCLLAAGLATVALAALAGTPSVNFNNRVPGAVDAPVSDATGARLEGTNWQAQLWVETGDSFNPVGVPVFFRTGPAAGYFDVGLDSSRPIPPGESRVKVVVWSVDDPMMRGESLPLLVEAGDPLLPPVNLVGLQPFTVPEPQAKWLAGLGALALAALLRARATG